MPAYRILSAWSPSVESLKGTQGCYVLLNGKCVHVYVYVYVNVCMYTYVLGIKESHNGFPGLCIAPEE